MSESLPFHLCQPGGSASCGACCGQYNVRDHRRGPLERALLRRTEALSGLAPDPELWQATARGLRRWDREVVFDAVRVCPLLGFVDDDRTRVGCLGHPAVTGGPDLRDCGVWTAQTCASFECPSFLWLTAAQARLVREACPDWYVYGLVITDAELVRGLLALVERALGRTVDPDELRASPAALAAAAELFAAKEPAPERRPAARLGRFDRDELGEPVARLLDYQGLGATPDPLDELVLCLGVAPGSAAELEVARARVRGWVDGVTAALDP